MFLINIQGNPRSPEEMTASFDRFFFLLVTDQYTLLFLVTAHCIKVKADSSFRHECFSELEVNGEDKYTLMFMIQDIHVGRS